MRRTAKQTQHIYVTSPPCFGGGAGVWWSVVNTHVFFAAAVLLLAPLAATAAPEFPTPAMSITELREKYNLRMRVERYVSDTGIPAQDKQFIRE